MPERIWIVVPTYNEAANLEVLVRAVGVELDKVADDGYRVLIVDDNSPDGTGAIADTLAQEQSWVEVLHRTGKDGLGRAYRAGFAHALAAGAEILIQMDADFSHDPRYLPELLNAVSDADLVLGSRYVNGGGVRDWGLVRRAVSRGGGLYARMLLGVRIRDLTGGFKCIRREVLEAIDLDTIRADGYGFQIEVTYRTLRTGFKVVEVPIIFPDRQAGASKMSAQIAFEAVWLVPRLRGWTPRRVAAAGEFPRLKTDPRV